MNQETQQVMGVGYLGATFDMSHGVNAGQHARDTMIERRILRLEMVLRRAGIEVEQCDLPRVAP